MLRTSHRADDSSKAGVGPNVIPSEAEATFDVRALPDEDIPRLFAEVTRLIGDEAVKVEPITTNLRPVSPPSEARLRNVSRAGSDLPPRCIRASTVLPTMMTGATDMAQLRAKGIQAYGIGPASTDSDTINYGAHSDVERLLESELYRFVEFTWRAVMLVAANR